jgi:hypothetical protein
MARPDEPRDSDLEKRKKKEIGRRDFVKLMGGASAAVTTAVLASDKLLGATPGSGPEPQEMAGVAMGKVIGPGPVPLTLRINGAAEFPGPDRLEKSLRPRHVRRMHGHHQRPREIFVHGAGD